MTWTCFKMSIRKVHARTWCWFVCFLVDMQRMLLPPKTRFLGSLWIPVKHILADVMLLKNKCIDSITFTTLCKVELTEATFQCLTCNSFYFSTAIISLLPDNNTIPPGIPHLSLLFSACVLRTTLVWCCALRKTNKSNPAWRCR